jgi:hypothetical protein
MAKCPDWVDPESDEKLRPVVEGMTEFHRFILKRASSRFLLSPEIKIWHERVFRGVVPLSYHAGNFRSDSRDRPCLAQEIQIGGSSGAPYRDVPHLMQELSDEMRIAIIATDKYVSSGPTATHKARAVVQLAALYAGKIIQIHPFINGNGRMSRLLTNYVLCRYGYPTAYYDSYPRPGGDYAAANAACMSGNFSPLYQYLLVCLGQKSG